MAEATLRGHVEVEENSAKALSKAGWPVEVRYFIPKAGTKAGTKVTPRRTQKSEAQAQRRSARNNFIGLGDASYDELYGDRRRVSQAAREAIEKRPYKIIRRTTLRDYLARKLKLNKQQASSQLSHVIRLGVLKDVGQTPPEWEKASKSNGL